jgi:hypothetical protein
VKEAQDWNDSMLRQQPQIDSKSENDLLSRRIARIRLDTAKLNPDQCGIFHDIQKSCPSCENPGRCASDLAAASPDRGWEDWDEYCPNAAKLRILAALTMFPSAAQ